MICDQALLDMDIIDYVAGMHMQYWHSKDKVYNISLLPLQFP
jgi:hypothetical protein